MRQPKRRTEILAELTPMIFRNGQKYFDHPRIELRSGATLNLFACVGHRQRFAVRAITDHRVHAVGDREYACTQRNLLTFETAWITRAVVELLVRQDNFRGVAQE